MHRLARLVSFLKIDSALSRQFEIYDKDTGGSYNVEGSRGGVEGELNENSGGEAKVFGTNEKLHLFIAPTDGKARWLQNVKLCCLYLPLESDVCESVFDGGCPGAGEASQPVTSPLGLASTHAGTTNTYYYSVKPNVRQ